MTKPLRSRAFLLAGMATILASASARAGDAPASDTLVLHGVTVVDTKDGKLSPDRDVVTSGGRIVAIVAAGKAGAAGARVIDATGKFVVPGYNDMHGHPLNNEGTARLNDLTLMLASGITGFRQMSGTPITLKERRDGTALPFADAPAILAMPGEVLGPFNAATPAAAVAEVDRQKAEGADFIKVVEADAPTFFAIGAEAKKVGLPFLGHLPDRVDALEASKAGYRSIEHLGPWATILTSCSSDEAGIRATIARHPSRTFAGTGEQLPPAMLDKIIARIATAPILAAMKKPDFAAFLNHVVATYDEAKCRQAAQVFLANDTWQSPTLIRVRTILFPDDPQSMNDPNLRYVSADTRALWADMAHQFAAGVTPQDRAALADFWKLQQRLLRLFDQTGVKMIAGSDTPGQWDIAGFSLHQDFDLLAANGVAPLKILQMTTLNPARFLGREAVMGSVAPGRNADLVLLDGNPVASAVNLHRIAGLVRAGHYYGRADLDALLAQTADRVAANAAPAAATGPLTIDTPIEQVMASPAGKAVLDRNLPGLALSPVYDMIKDKSLRAVQPMSQGRLTVEQLGRIAAELAALPK